MQTVFKQYISEHKEPLLWWLLWFVFTLVMLWWPTHHDFAADEGYFVEMSARVLRGERPHIDFATNYLGLLYDFNALLFSTFEKKLIVMRYGMAVLTSALFTPLLFFTARLMIPTKYAAISTIFILSLTIGLAHPVSGNWYGLYGCLLSIYLLLNAIQHNKKIPFFGVGLCLGLAALMKHTLVIFTSLGLFLMLLYIIFEDKIPQQETKKIEQTGWYQKITSIIHKKRLNRISLTFLHLALFSIPITVVLFLHQHLDFTRFIFYIAPILVLTIDALKRLWRDIDHFPALWLISRIILIKLGSWLVLGLYFLPVIIQGKLPAIIQEVFFHYPKIYLKYAYLNYFSNTWFFKLNSIVWTDPASLINNIVSLLLCFPLVCVITFMVFWVGDNRNKILKEHFTAFCLLIWGLFLWLNTYPLGVMNYWAYSMTPFLLALSAVLYRYSHKQSKAVKVIVSMITIFGVSFGQLWLVRQIGLGNQQFPNKTFPVSLSIEVGEPIHVTEKWGQKILGEVKFIQEKTLATNEQSQKDNLFLYHDEPILYFWTDRINPTRYSYAIDARLSRGHKVVNNLEKHNVQYVLRDFEQNHFMNPEVNEYLNAYFKPIASPAQNVLAFERKK